MMNLILTLESATSGGQRTTKMSTILVVDDDETFRRLLCQTLQPTGHKILAAADGSAALKLFRQ
jgi:CheY-like chemotaxis protein